MLTLLGPSEGRKAKYLCHCGKETFAHAYDVKSGHTRSCGCERTKATTERSITHGHKRDGKRTPAYVCWMNMRARCDKASSKSFKDYGARGIYYAPEWAKFENFLADMGEPPTGLTLDRRESNGPYCKSNCRWATRAEQNLNKRNCVRYEFDGKNQTLAEWSRETGIGRTTLLLRIQKGIPVEIALTTPAHQLPANAAATALLRIA